MNYTFWLEAHSGIRWLIVLVGLFSLLRFTSAWLLNGTYLSWDRRLLAALNGLIGLQFLLGVVLIVWVTLLTGGGRLGTHIFHMLPMIAAIGVVGAASGRIRRSASDRERFRTGTIAVAVAALLIFIGVMLVGGW